MSFLVILRRELASYFLTPLGWAVMALFLLVEGYAFYLLVELSAQPYAPHGAVMRLFFGGTILYWIFFIVVVSVTTMRLLAEERRSGTLEPLLTAPVSEVVVVLGKYAAAVTFFASLWLPTLSYVLLAWQLQRDPPLDWGPVAASYLGTLLIGCSCLALGMMCSALARSQMIAALATFVLLALLLLLEPLQQVAHSERVRAVVGYLDLFAQMDDFARGIVDSRHLLLHASLVLFALVVAVKALERRR